MYLHYKGLLIPITNDLSELHFDAMDLGHDTIYSLFSTDSK